MGKELNNPLLCQRMIALRIIQHLEGNKDVVDIATRIDEVVRIMNPDFSEYYDKFKSDNIAGFGYDDISHTLTVDFNTGSRYRYYGVVPATYKSLVESESKGSFIAANIKANCPYEKLG